MASRYRKILDFSLLATFTVALMAANVPINRSAIAVDYKLGILLMPNYQEPVTYAVLGLHKGEVISKSYLTQEEFILIGTGNIRSKANPEKANFFAKYDVPYCEATYDSVFTSFSVQCKAMNNLWKLRYQVRPGDPIIESTASVEEGTSKGGGWARTLHAPDEAQIEKLAPFGINKLHQFSYGADAFRLIKASNDPSWIQGYK